MTNPTPTQPDWEKNFRKDFFQLFKSQPKYAEAVVTFIQSVADTSYEKGIVISMANDEVLLQQAYEKGAKQAVDTFRKRVEEKLVECKGILHRPEEIVGYLKAIEVVKSVEEAEQKVREM